VFFLIPEARTNVTLPADLDGIISLPIVERQDRDFPSMVRGACRQIRQSVVELGNFGETEIRRSSAGTTWPNSQSTTHFADLSDIEVRGESVNTVAPEQFVQETRGELLIAALTAKNTLLLLRQQLIDLLERRVFVGVLLLDPDSDEVQRLAKQQRLLIRPELQESIEILRRDYLSKYPGHFQYRFFQNSPTFTAIMRDGAAFIRQGFYPNADGGAVRVQPRAMHAPQLKGVVLTFRGGTNGPSAFTYFAGDLREQWNRAHLDGRA
jgi:hypothetical protein